MLFGRLSGSQLPRPGLFFDLAEVLWKHTHTKHKGPKLLYRAEPESITKSKSGEQVTIEAITIVTSVLDSWGIPQEPDTYTPPPPTTDSEDAQYSTTVVTVTAPYENPTPTVRNQYPPPSPCSANAAQFCVELGGRTFVVDVSNGQAVPPTDSILHSTATENPDTITKPFPTPLAPKGSPTPISTSTSRSNSFSSSSTSSSSPSLNSNTTSPPPSTSSQTAPAKSTGLRKTKNPWLLLVVCCAGAVMYEIGVWTEKTKEEEEKAAEDAKNEKVDETKKKATV